MYSDFDYYQKEYEKYDVLSDLDMEMKDVMYVTEEMMAYLRGDRENLSVVTTVEGAEQDFFNEQDRFHMWEVQKLFVGGLNLRRGAVSLLLNCLLLMALLNEVSKNRMLTGQERIGKIEAEKVDLKKVLSQSFQIVVAGLLVVVSVIGIAAVRDFNKVFTLFHEVFFDNDLWIFDPAKDYMIRMLPEGLFYDFVIRIGGLFIVMLLTGFVVSVIFCKKRK